MKKIILTLLLLLPLTLQAQNHKQKQKSDLELAKAMEVFNRAFIDINMAYVDTIVTNDMLTDIMNGMLKNLDPYTEYIEPKNLEDFQTSVTGKYGGIGALIRQRGEWTEVAEPYKDTPSDIAGLKAGDVLLEIDSVSLKGFGSQKVVEMLKGDPHTSFMLKYRPIADTNTTKTVEVTRQIITLPAVPYYGVVSQEKQKIGYIILSSFTDHCAKEFENAYLDLVQNEKITSLIIDLRGNGGGVVGQAVEMINMFVPEGLDVLKVKGKVGKLSAKYTTENPPINTEMPLAVLINSSSASASEIFAGAIQDLDRGVVIGARSFGKGLVQTTEKMPNDGLLKFTIAKYYTPSGRCIQAVDYKNKREDGSVGEVPDSLIQTFSTTNNRKVYDGGGIMPDIKIKPEYLSKFSAILLANGFVDDFANIFAAKYKPTDSKFVMTQEIYNDFKKFIKTKTVKFESLSAMKLEELTKIAKEEKYDSLITTELKSIAKKIKDDKDAELERNSKDLKELLSEQILTRLYYQHKAIEYSVANDPVVDTAIEILNDTTQYNKILKEQDTSKN